MSRRHLKYLTHNFWKSSSFKIVTAWQLSSVLSIFFYNVLQTDWRADKSDLTQTGIFKYSWLKRRFNENAYTDITSSILFLKSQITQLKSLLKIRLYPPPLEKGKSLHDLLRQNTEVIRNHSDWIFTYLFLSKKKSQYFIFCVYTKRPILLNPMIDPSLYKQRIRKRAKTLK